MEKTWKNDMWDSVRVGLVKGLSEVVNRVSGALEKAANNLEKRIQNPTNKAAETHEDTAENVKKN